MCAFFGADTIENCHKDAKMLGKSGANTGDTYTILSAKEVWNTKKGTLGTVITDCVLIEKGTI